ncbi:MAG: type 2 isopentenyl-diphosphate Delta-isomerase [Candidatus Thermofonsia Clade 1 bacterium]|jgi:isopentenyl-diphosphate delta-isomerase|uniref:Isopentenyl-diphosphate delta-isomerase n=1 Tax=Candidatus Thermofonsia Clade 1 bacterium TaxID=2364210 RepID=A0A2M8P2A1_9CHLR|nr:MAG: type 2 isopentenyl-diphosphate Delta-isomerase [Candidatus Thermofonsia Clade 1 bacterium]
MTVSSDDPQLIERRKADHIRINLEENVQFPRLTTGLERYRFMHCALPELDLAEIDTSLVFMGKRLSAPLLISSMTGGTSLANPLNLVLAEVAQAHSIAMGLGSQRAAIVHEDLAQSFKVRHVAPDILLFANVGAVQLNYGFTVEHYRRAVDMAEADALILHFNALQEAVQPEGDGNFKDLLPKVAHLCRTVGVPVIAKEVGWGFSAQDARRLVEAGVAAIDVAGAGGTSWSEVEYHRAPTAFHARVARAFADWGIPTAESIQLVREAAPNVPIIASGGLRDGIDVAKCIALGAELCGLAGPFLKAAAQSAEATHELVRELTAQLRITMFVAGARDLAALARTPLYSA